jgi:hypothetical protein
MPKPDPDYDQLPLPQRVGDEAIRAEGLSEIDHVILAAHALELDAPIIHYRIVGDRIELWTCHGGPFVYEQVQAAPAPAPKKVVRKKK